MANQALALVLKFSQGTAEVTAGSDHPGVAAFRRAMEEGQLTGTWRYLIVYALPVVPYTIIGTFVRTPKSSSHVAVQALPHDESRGLNYRSAPPPEHMFPWFSLLAPDVTGFTELPGQLVVRFPPPPGDLHEFGERLLADSNLGIVPLPSATGPGPTYVQFDVWLGRGPDWKTLQVRPLAWSYKPDIVEEAPDPQDVTVNRVDIDLGPEIGVAVLVLRPAGRLRRLRILRATLSR